MIRLTFEKTGEAAYISHLDLQRVMARALRRSGMPVWYSQGFNPHIYMRFALPLPLMQESVVECVDCKTEAGDDTDFAAFLPALNSALPRGITAKQVGPAVNEPGRIASAAYHMRYAAQPPERLRAAFEGLQAAQNIDVVLKRKRSEEPIDLKMHLADLAVDEDEKCLRASLPAGGQLNINPMLLAGWLEENQGLPAAEATILRVGVFMENGMPFV